MNRQRESERFLVSTVSSTVMNLQLVVLGLLTGLLTGAFFAVFDVPIPAPPELPGLMGIVGIYLGYKLVQYLGVSVGVFDSVGF